jgi:predicted Ser/Thr protein kinase
MPDPHTPVDLDPRVSAAVQEYLERIDRGEVVDREQFLAKYADVADQVRSFIASSEDLARWARRSDVSVVSTNSVAADSSRVQAAAKPPARSMAVGGSQFDVLPADFGRYRVLKMLGRGAMGSVFLAEDRQLERQIALKIPSFDNDESGELLTRFYREARSAAMLRQPNICPVYDVGEIDGQHYISMAYIPGRTLAELIKSDKPPSERAALLIVRKLALALQEAHAQGILHRDLKPGNVMIDARGEPIVMDFGLACRLEQTDAARLTQSGMIVGSPAYMSPEQVEGNPDKLTPAADQYSLGVILYELLTGQLPFKGGIAAVIAQIATKAPQPPRELKPEIDPRVEAACLRMLSKNAADRFPSLKSVADELAAILRDPKGNPEASTSRAATSVTTSLAERQRQIQQWVKDGDLTSAREALEGLAALTDPRQVKARDWARSQLQNLQADEVRWAVELPRLLELARSLIRKHDYADAAKLLAEVPAVFRTPELTDVLERATEQQEECDALLADIDRAIRKVQPDELPALVKRLLKLKPGHTGMRRLSAEMKKHGVARAIQTRQGNRTYFDPAGPLWNPLHAAYVAGGLAALFAVVYLAVITFQTTNGTVVIEVHDPDLIVSFADELTTVDSSGRRYQLKTTDQQTLEIEYDGLIFTAPTVTVKRGGVTQVVASVQGSQPVLTINGVTQELMKINPGHDPQAGSGITSLFNGRDLAGWTESPAGRSKWKVVDGALVGQSQNDNSFLVSDRGDYSNFRLTAEVQYENSNGGLYFRVQRNGDKVLRGYEADIVSGSQGGTGNLFLSGTNPLRMAQRAEGPFPTPGQWFTLTVECIDQAITVALDGRTALKYCDEANHSSRGHLMLQAFDGTIRFRTIHIVELPDSGPPVGEAGFTSLFNGRDFTGWEGDPSGWIISNGVLGSRRGLEGPTALLTEQEFADYELRLQFRLLNFGKAAVFARGLRDDQGRAVGDVAELGYLRLAVGRPQNVTGDLFRRQSRPPQVKARPPADFMRKLTRKNFLSHAEGERRAQIDAVYRGREWNDLTIRCVGQRVVVELNGHTTADYSATDVPPSGRIGLQLWATMDADEPIATTPDIQFRNIRVKELTAPSPSSAIGTVELFNGRDLTGWTPLGNTDWRVENGVLVSDSGGRGALWTDKDYADFDLELDYRLSAGGNTGVFLRSKGALRMEDFEIQLVDDDAYPGTQSWQKTGSIYGVVPPTVNFARRGDWNQLRIRLDGRRLQVWINGHEVQNRHLDDYRKEFVTRPSMQRPAGYIGLQTYG